MVYHIGGGSARCAAVTYSYRLKLYDHNGKAKATLVGTAVTYQLKLFDHNGKAIYQVGTLSAELSPHY